MTVGAGESDDPIPVVMLSAAAKSQLRPRPQHLAAATTVLVLPCCQNLSVVTESARRRLLVRLFFRLVLCFLLLATSRRGGHTRRGLAACRKGVSPSPTKMGDIPCPSLVGPCECDAASSRTLNNSRQKIGVTSESHVLNSNLSAG
jgi:hypothetical protein